MKTKLTIIYSATKTKAILQLIFSLIVMLSGILLLLTTSHVKGVHMINVLCGLITFGMGASLAYKYIIILIAILMKKSTFNL